MRTIIYTLLLLGLGFLACQPTATEDAAPPESTEVNPAAEGFDAEGSDEKAIALADQVMEAMGGRPAWDATRYLKWNFFGARILTWDKQENLVRIEMPSDSIVLVANYLTQKGKAWVNSEEITEPDSLAPLMERARNIWINDSYWLVMPFKLKDSGVTLRYVGADTTQTGEAAEVLELAFKEVGVTPHNKYRVWVSQADQLIKQWAFYVQNTDDTPRFITPWGEYQPHGEILLGGDRGERDMMDIQVFTDLPAETFTKL